MAALLDDSSSSRVRGLGVSKSKINKLRRGGGAGGGSGGVNQRPPPTVYKTEPEGFRSLVQELTGPSPAAAAFAPSSSSSSSLSFLSSGGDRISRIQRMAPPPLVPAPKSLPPSPPPVFPKFLESFPSSSPKFSFPFSPLVDFSPRELMWSAGLESPGAADMKTLAQLIARDDPSPRIERSFSFSSFNNSSSSNADFTFS